MNKEVYFHLGLGKTGSTYMQYKVFPKFKGVHYIQRTKYRRCFNIIKNTDYEKYFASVEFDRQFPHELNLIAHELNLIAHELPTSQGNYCTAQAR